MKWMTFVFFVFLLPLRSMAAPQDVKPALGFNSKNNFQSRENLEILKTGFSLQKESVEISEIAGWIEKIKLSGTLAGEFRWMKHSDVTLKSSKAVSDLYIRMLDLGLEVAFLDWVNAIAVMNSEWIGDSLNQGEEKIMFDEVHLDLRLPNTPLYLVFGKRTLPFGLFENYLITDPMTQDAYETKRVGLSLGLNGPLDSDLSLSLYKGDEQMNHLFQGELLDTNIIKRAPAKGQNIDSFILSTSLSPLKKYLALYGAYLSEPGTRERNTTLNIAISFTFPFLKNLVVDGEFMKALSREKYQELSRNFREGILSVTATYLFLLRERKLRGSGNYLQRKSHIRFHPIEVAARYEYFDDDSMSEALQSWTVKNRYSVGGRYSFYEDGKIIAYLESEYRRTNYRVPLAREAAMDEGNHEIYVRLGIDF